MAFDGITVSALVAEIDDNLKGGRINKIAQPENDELLITGKGANGQKRLLLSASASLPLIYFTDKNRISPLTAPNFCMLLRKHIGSARILDVKQPGMERVVEFELEHLNELGVVAVALDLHELLKGRLVIGRVRREADNIFMPVELKGVDLVQLARGVQPVGFQGRLVQLFHLCVQSIVLEF